jgi:hypothetical protein
VLVKNLDSHSVKALLASRALLVKSKRDLENQDRGLLKNLGLVIGRAKFNVFAVRAEELIEDRPELVAAVGPLLEARKAIEQQIDDLTDCNICHVHPIIIMFFANAVVRTEGSKTMRAICCAALIAISSSSYAYAWGQEGHSIVAEIAQHRLNDNSLAKIELLLGENVSLASTASWADAYRDTHPDTAAWHFVNISDDRATYDPAVDCAKDDCLIYAIKRFTDVLANCAKTAGERAQALKFVVHFVGDIHQPLHATDRIDPYTLKPDKGGNLIKVTFFGTDTNLHAVWDTGLIMHTVYDWGTYVDRLEANWLAGRDLTDLSGGLPIDWAEEAHQFAHSVAYDYPDDGILALEYLHKSQPVVDRQLALAGVRLARLLNETLAAACR